MIKDTYGLPNALPDAYLRDAPAPYILGPAHVKVWTYQDYLELPDDDGLRYEIIEGELFVANAPSAEHQYVVTEIVSELRNFVKRNKLGIVLPAPFEIHLSKTTRPVQPDVIFIKRENWSTESRKLFAGVPDLLVEVISPSSIRRDRILKFDAYERAGVNEYWLVNPKTRSVEVYTLSGKEYALHGEFTADERLTSIVLPDLTIDVEGLFF